MRPAHLPEMERIRQTVLTIHGVNPDRTWQQMVGRVFEPHFRHVPIEYDEYLGLKGPIIAVFSLWFAPLIVVGFVLAVLMMLQRHWELALASLISALASLALGLWVAHLGRQACLNRVKPKLIAATAGDPVEPHVVAHSFGTYLIGSALRKFPEVMVKRMVLVGSVLPRHYDWSKVLTDKPTPFTVRNETGKRDLVVKLAGLIKCVARDMGNAGLKGFAITDVVHDTTTVWGPCEECEGIADAVPIHNVPLDQFGHSTHFLGSSHGAKLWLPYLWGYTPREFHEYLQLCHAAAFLRQEQRWSELKEIEHALLRSNWTWTKGRTLKTFIKRSVEAYLHHARRVAVPRPDREMREIVEEAIRFIYLAVFEAWVEQEKLGDRNDEVVRALYPPTAIVRAIELALDEAA